MINDLSIEDVGNLLTICNKSCCDCTELVLGVKELNYPELLISDLVNIQREKYGLDKSVHNSYKDILSDEIVCDGKYYFKCKSLKVILASLIVGYGKIPYIIKIITNGERLISQRVEHDIDCSSYLDKLLNL